MYTIVVGTTAFMVYWLARTHVRAYICIYNIFVFKTYFFFRVWCCSVKRERNMVSRCVF